MARSELSKRLAALEVGDAMHFTGYACVEVYEDQNVEQAKAAWEAENGPVGTRQVVLWNFGGRSAAEWQTLCSA